MDIGYAPDSFAAVPGWKSPEGLMRSTAPVLVPPDDGTSIDSEDMLNVRHAAAGR